MVIIKEIEFGDIICSYKQGPGDFKKKQQRDQQNNKEIYPESTIRGKLEIYQFCLIVMMLLKRFACTIFFKWMGMFYNNPG